MNLISTKYTIEELSLLSGYFRGILSKDTNNIATLSYIFLERRTIRTIARILETDNTFFVSLQEKIDVANRLIEVDISYSSCEDKEENQYNRGMLEAHNKCKEIFLIPYEDLPLHVSDKAPDFAKVILKWRLKIGK